MKLPDSLVTSDEFAGYVSEKFSVLHYFNRYINDIIDHGPDESSAIKVF